MTIYGCEPDEAASFRALAPRHGVAPTITAAPLCEDNAGLALGSRCVSVSHRTPVSRAALLALAQAGVSYLSTRSVGCDHIDVDFAAAAGIRVGTVAYSPDSVADYTLMLMLMAVRGARTVVLRTEAGDYRLDAVRGRELRDLTVGVVGTGRIGSAVVDRLRGFGARTLAHDRAHGVALDELLERSDIVTLHTPLTPETRHLLDRRRIARMKRGAVVVNTARGGLIDTEALATALERGRLGGAALDVLEGEEQLFGRNRPAEGELVRRLRRLPNVLITPHTAYYTDHALRDTVEQSLTNCLRHA